MDACWARWLLERLGSNFTAQTQILKCCIRNHMILFHLPFFSGSWLSGRVLILWGMVTLLKAWWPYQRHGDPAKGKMTLPKAWWLCIRHGMVTMPKAWWLCQRHGEPANGVVTLLQRHGEHATHMGTLPKAWLTYQKHGDPTKGMVTMPKAWLLCWGNGDLAKGMVTMPKAWFCNRQILTQALTPVITHSFGFLKKFNRIYLPSILLYD